MTVILFVSKTVPQSQTINKYISYLSQVWWCTSLIPALEWLKQENHKFQANMGYIVRHWHKDKHIINTAPQKACSLVEASLIFRGSRTSGKITNLGNEMDNHSASTTGGDFSIKSSTQRFWNIFGYYKSVVLYKIPARGKLELVSSDDSRFWTTPAGNHYYCGVKSIYFPSVTKVAPL
jgi:hypothetical protein